MSEHNTEHEGGPRHDDIRFEGGEVSVKPIVWTSIIGSTITAAFVFGMWVLYGALAEREAVESKPRNVLAATYARTQPPEPRLQAKPVEDLLALRAREDALLHGYAWIDRRSGTVKVPIERAMELYANANPGLDKN